MEEVTGQESSKERKEYKIKVGISHGDMNGISYEVIMKTFMDQRVLESMTPILYGSAKIASYYRKTLNIPEFNFNVIKRAEHASPKRMNILNFYDDEVKIELGRPSGAAGELAYRALELSVSDLKKNLFDVLVTAPINKANIKEAGFEFPGHTEYLADRLECPDYLMMMVCPTLRIAVITTHIPYKDVPLVLTKDLILKKIDVFHHSLIRDFGVRKPKIALLALNPHAGENGLIGQEENDILLPAIQEALEKDYFVFGPFPADGFFASSLFAKFDGILALYHDQGMIPFKLMAFDEGVNFTAGLPYVRTSPAHGTAYDIAGKNEASPDSFRQAIYLAIDIFNKRAEYDQLTASPLEPGKEAVESPEPVNGEEPTPA